MRLIMPGPPPRRGKTANPRAGGTTGGGGLAASYKLIRIALPPTPRLQPRRNSPVTTSRARPARGRFCVRPANFAYDPLPPRRCSPYLFRQDIGGPLQRGGKRCRTGG